MATQRYVSTSFWDDEWIQTLDPSEKLLYLYLMTNPLTNIAGVYKLTDRRIGFDTGFNLDTIRHIFAKFQKAGKAFRKGEYVIIPSWPKHQKWERSKKVQIGIEMILYELEPEIIGYLLAIGYRYPIDTLDIPYAYPSNYSDSDSDSDSDTDTTRSVCPEVPAEPEPVETAPPSPVFLELPCIVSKKNPTGLYAVTEAEIEEHHQIFPALDIHQEFRDMLGWLKAKPANKKSDVKSFIYRWLKKSQDKAPASQPRNPTPTGMAPSAMRTNDAFKGHKSGKIDF